MTSPGGIYPPLSWDGAFSTRGHILAHDDAIITCIHYFNEPLSHLGLVGSSGGGLWSNGAKGRTGADPWGMPRVIAAGDSKGFIYLMTAAGTEKGMLFERYDTAAGSPITSMASYSLRRNESVLVTGHANGEVRMVSLNNVEIIRSV